MLSEHAMDLTFFSYSRGHSKIGLLKNQINYLKTHRLENPGQTISMHSLLNCDVATHDEKMMLANLKFLTKFLMSHASIKDISI